MSLDSENEVAQLNIEDEIIGSKNPDHQNLKIFMLNDVIQITQDSKKLPKLNEKYSPSKEIKKFENSIDIGNLAFKDIKDIYYADYAEQFFGSDEDYLKNVKKKCKTMLIQLAKYKTEITHHQSIIMNNRTSVPEKEIASAHIVRIQKCIAHTRAKVEYIVEHEIIQLSDIEQELFINKNAQSQPTENEIVCDPIEIKKFRSLLDEKSRQARKLLKLSIVDAKALANRTSADSISDLVDIYNNYKRINKINDYEGVIQSSLSSKPKATALIELLGQLSGIDFKESNNVKLPSIKKYSSPLPIELSKKPAELNITNEDKENIYLFMPFWQTRLTDKSDMKARALRNLFGVNLEEVLRYEEITNQKTVENYVNYYNSKKEMLKNSLFLPEHLVLLHNLGISKEKTVKFVQKILSLAAQYLQLPSFLHYYMTNSIQTQSLCIKNQSNVTVQMFSGILGCILSSKIKLKRIVIENLNLPKGFLELIRLAILKCPPMLELNISGNFLSDEGLKKLIDSLKSETGSILKVLFIDNCSITTHSGLRLNTLIKPQLKAIEKGFFIIVLSITGNEIGNAGAESVAEYLGHNKSLRYLNLSKNNIGDKGMVRLLEKIKVNTTLIVFIAKDNSLTSECLYKADVQLRDMNKNSSLVILKVGTLSVSKEEARVFFNVLNLIPSLEYFELSFKNTKAIKTIQSEDFFFTTNRAGVFRLIEEPNQPNDLNFQNKINKLDPNLLFTSKNVFNLLAIVEDFELDEILPNCTEAEFHIAPLKKEFIDWITKHFPPESEQSKNNTKKEVPPPENQGVFSTFENSIKMKRLLNRILMYMGKNSKSIENLEIMVAIIKSGIIKPTDLFENGQRLLHLLVRFGIEFGVKYMIKKFKNLNQCTSYTDKYCPVSSPLHYACCYEQVEIARFFIECGADADSLDYNQNSALVYSMIVGNITLVKLLIDKSQTVLQPNKKGWEPIHNAVYCNNISVFELILEAAAKLLEITKTEAMSRQTSITCDTPLIIASEIKANNIVDYIISQNGNLNNQNSSGKTALITAISHNNDDIAIKLIKNNANLELKDKQSGDTAVFYAVKLGNLAILRELHQNGANLKATNAKGDNLLHYAARLSRADVIRYLLDYGVNPNGINNLGCGPKDFLKDRALESLFEEGSLKEFNLFSSKKK